MSLRHAINNEYFEWMYNLVCGDRYAKEISFRFLLNHLHNTEFTFSIPKDQNRAEDGIDLRRRFTMTCGYEEMSEYLYDRPCSVLEMMVALSIRCEETIMDDPNVGDRTSQWFWNMIVSLGLGSMRDSRYDADYVALRIDRFLRRDYDPCGRGGLFTIKNCDRDLRDVEIWCQLCWYLDATT